MPPATIPNVSVSECDGQRTFDGVPFPLVLKPQTGLSTSSDVISWLSTNAEALKGELTKYGAVLFRDFPIQTPEDFAAFVEALGEENFPYIGGNAVRTNVVRDVVFTANESPPSEKIPWHHEMAQLPEYPTKLLFFCERPAARGGETPIVLSFRVLERVREKHPEFVAALEEQGVRYIRVAPEESDPTSALGRGWKSTFKVETREEAEERMKADGYEWEWLPNGDLKTITKPLPAVKKHPLTQRPQFFNQVIAAYTGWNDSRNVSKKAIVLGKDGTFLNEEAMAEVVRVTEEEKAKFGWQKGDVLLVDNLQAMHSRSDFEPPRRILASILR
uniref:TauD/TfdA-like domain-containing protein n=1 Tax=Chromera velia CCMP2878 TaxID=1169474 RepID=A0A0G4H0Q4_9ALVE|mmetsp:Transcript_15552/g.31569  ORF Transcript_15552/g.31569 Transcript_15552/m.31569 type:complete len:331 (-) Transcript_15552:399-1391(-)|eukprot:Cvel_24190.t1-p1 / transcript=Cvel_24190.t1 / gene=Cvel_24190 / organism=Chromera_velia_CCMP2878 / gene_product=Clavaminate synthase-like protein At3g21360, putative / transcript_product=Clavaminate synthase-like protein At3g21360, putative / location=Cvel_scaffold2583:15825-18092(-) / protein_length=330 / sequence_SO=supercontig / SO=protein_coding / is_pseudo=false